MLHFTITFGENSEIVVQERTDYEMIMFFYYLEQIAKIAIIALAIAATLFLVYKTTKRFLRK